MGDREPRLDLEEILRITSANIIQELADYYPPSYPYYQSSMNTPSYPKSLKPAFAGVSGGLLSTLLLHPLDTLKIRSAAGRGNCTQTFRVLTRAGWPGLAGMRMFYQGISPNCTLSAFSWGLYFFSYEAAKKRLGTTSGEPSSMVQVLAAMEAGIWTMVFTNPLQVLRTRMVLCPQASSMGSFPLALGIVQREGLGALFRGFSPNLIGVTHGTMQFSLYEEMKVRYKTWSNSNFKSNLNIRSSRSSDYSLVWWEHIGLAAASKMLASVVTYPCQVVRTVLQNEPSIPGAGTPLARDVVRTLVREEGIKGLYRGLAPHLLHVTPNVCIIFAVYEAVMKYC